MRVKYNRKYLLNSFYVLTKNVSERSSVIQFWYKKIILIARVFSSQVVVYIYQAKRFIHINCKIVKFRDLYDFYQNLNYKRF